MLIFSMKNEKLFVVVVVAVKIRKCNARARLHTLFPFVLVSVFLCCLCKMKKKKSSDSENLQSCLLCLNYADYDDISCVYVDAMPELVGCLLDETGMLSDEFF